jgi:phytoene synthase
MRAQSARAREAYRSAFASLPERDRKAQRPGLIMAAIYKTLLDEVEADGFRVLTHRTSLTPIRKLWLATCAWLSGRPPRV